MMCRHIDVGMVKPTGTLLTEENLRLHRATLKSSNVAEANHDVALSDDGDYDAMHDIALRRAASLEALQAYGGCFVSGFLAMQEPLPWMSTATTQSTSNRSIASSGSPRPDSDTLSHTDTRDATVERKRSWRSLTRLRIAGRKLK
ncbi:hypothetical protein FB567DRAFT_179239 [Paraphoma chrysanthemicola]|uniref:Uncharacterized protein n=1 Tax=Paraphoma chrysanthemicola TaxID=798071 RepID=A0A8K0RJ06_9PLEO|nr:hypothetical protein FB567DRAFT_179239 [Paraphoma chrysanthemicola]